MNMRTIIEQNPVLAILRNVPMDIVEPYVESILRGGVRFFEVALNSSDALQQIRFLKDRFGDEILLGAGTAITVELAQQAVEAGAAFLLSPSSDVPVLDYCSRKGIAMLPGALTPTDVSTCVSYGFSTIKLFPAGDMPKNYVKSLKGPFDGTEYVAIGGVNPDNLADFLKSGYLGVGLGSNMVPKDAVKARDWDRCITYVADICTRVEAARK